MSTSSAPCSTTQRTSSSFASSGDWPEGNAVATEATFTSLPRTRSTAVGTRFGYTQTAATDGTPGSEGSGRIALEASAATLPGVSAPSSVVRSVTRTASSRAKTFDSRLIERFASVPARSSIATWSIEPIRGSRGSSGSSNQVGRAGGCAITMSVSPSLRQAVPRRQDIRDLVEVVADSVSFESGSENDRADSRVVCAADVARGIADCHRALDGPAAYAFAGDPDERAALLGVAAESALTLGEEPVETEAHHAGAGHRLRVAGQQGETDARLCQPGEGSIRMWCDFPVVRACGREQVDVALRVEGEPVAEPLADRVVGEAPRAKHLAADTQARLARVVDPFDGIRGRIDLIELPQRWQERLARERVVGQEQRAVDVEQREERRHRPSRSSMAASRRPLGPDLTLSSRKTGWPSSSSISGRARVPICFTTEPLLPITICFCESVSTKIVARTTFSLTSSTSTEIAWGTSSRVSCSAFSRMSSAIWTSGPRSVRCSRG